MRLRRKAPQKQNTRTLRQEGLEWVFFNGLYGHGTKLSIFGEIHLLNKTFFFSKE